MRRLIDADALIKHFETIQKQEGDSIGKEPKRKSRGSP